MEKEPLGEQGLFDIALNLVNKGYTDFVLVVSKTGDKEGETDVLATSNLSVPDSVYLLELAKHDLMFPGPDNQD